MDQQNLKQQGFIRSHVNSNLYYKSKGGRLCVLVLYVDDLIITSNDLLLVEQIKVALCQWFEMTDLGTLHFLGLEIQQTPGGMFISQQRYVLKLLEKFQMREGRPISSPMDPNEKLSSNDSSGLADAVCYRQLVGSLIWLLNTRLDVSFVVGILSSFM